MKNLLLAITGFLTAVLSVSAVPIKGVVNSNATINNSTDTDSASWSLTPQDLAVSSSRNLGANSVLSSTEAHWAADGNSGSVEIQAAWNISEAGATHINTEGLVQWQYNFVADASGLFTIDYEISTAYSGLAGGFPVTYFGGDLGDASFLSDTSGQFSGQVVAGNSYSVYLYSVGNVGGGDLQGFAGSMVAEFDWSVTGTASVPDTTSVALMQILAFVGMAGLRRKLRTDRA
jgi:hypothetical protein